MQAASLEQGGKFMVKKSGTKSGKSTKGVKSLPVKTASAKQAKGVKGGSFSFGITNQASSFKVNKVIKQASWID
jgi:hypothetical protein